MRLAKNELRISITSRCNMKCIYCHNEGNTKIANLSKDKIREIIEGCKNLNLRKVRITGGEPLVSNEVEEICKMLSEEYKLIVEMNTNGIAINKIIKLIKNGWLKKVVIGIDYFDREVSKNSPVGKSSLKIKENILKIKKLGCEVRMATVYNGDNLNTINLIKWAVENDIGIRVIEIVKKEIDRVYSLNYMKLQEKVKDEIKLDWYTDGELEELNGSKNGKTLVKFYHSLCRLGRCDICNKIPFRITSAGVARPCILSTKGDVDLFKGNVHNNIVKVLKNKIKIVEYKNDC